MNKITLRNLLFCLTLSSCEYYDRRLEVINNTSYKIAVETFSDSIPTFSELNKTAYYSRSAIYPNESSNLIAMGSKREWSNKIDNNKNKKLNLLVFNIDSMEVYGVDSLVRMGFFNTYIISEDILEASNWKVKISE